MKINRKIYNPKPLRYIARENIELDDKQLNKKIAEKEPNPFFTDRALKIGPNINLDTHHINGAISKRFIKPSFPGIGFETRFKNQILKEMAILYASIIIENKFKYQTVNSARFHEGIEEIHSLDEIEQYIILKISHNLTERGIKNIHNKSPLEHQFQKKRDEIFWMEI